MRETRGGVTLVETLAGLLVGAVMIALALRAFAQLDALRVEQQRLLERDLARDRALGHLARDLERLALEAPARAPAAVLVEIEPGIAPAVVLDAGSVRWRLAAGHLYRNDALELASASGWHVLAWDASTRAFSELVDATSFTRDTLPLRLKIMVDGRVLERDLR